MYINNGNMRKGEKIYFSCLFGFLATLAVVLLYLALFEFPSSTTKYNVSKATFTINRIFDSSSNNWLVGVMDADNIKLGSFVCPVKPVNQNPVLYYQMTITRTLLAASTFSFDFSYMENCTNVSTQHQQATQNTMPNTRLAPPRKKGEFIL